MLKSFFLNLLFPLECLGCGREKFWLCETCFRKLKFNGQTKDFNLRTPHLTKIFIAGDYDDPLLAALIKKFKYGFITDYGKILARFLILFWSGQLWSIQTPPEMILIPLPLSGKRRRWRGFNQAEILARELSAHFAYPLNQELKRAGHRPPQAGLSEEERRQNIQNVFVWTGTDLNGRDVILLDDVVTTGATLDEAAKVLKAVGAGKIYGLVLAKG
ncbi:MAG: ComF family protein [Patescibacteria group bacterium]